MYTLSLVEWRKPKGGKRLEDDGCAAAACSGKNSVQQIMNEVIIETQKCGSMKVGDDR